MGSATSDGRRRPGVWARGGWVGMIEEAMINQEAQAHAHASVCALCAGLLGQRAPAGMRRPVLHQHLDEPTSRMALDPRERASGPV